MPRKGTPTPVLQMLEAAIFVATLSTQQIVLDMIHNSVTTVLTGVV
jgi:hypothetical protein